MSETPKYTRKDFKSDLDIRWCSGCGDYFVTQALQNVWASAGIPKEDFLVVSGIGCSSRFPYYTNTYGFHTIHGRAPTVALGAKVANPNLNVWVITGDGDAMSIGGNHILHLMRRNPDIKVVLFNNEIYGLTKGQTSPTSPIGTKTKSSPLGSVDLPLNPLEVALSAGATFVARTVDTNLAHMKEVFTAALHHKGAAFIEVYTTCVIFNDGVFDEFEKRNLRKEATVELKEGSELIYGAKSDKKLEWSGFTFEKAAADEDVSFKFSATPGHKNIARALLDLKNPDFPLPVGIFYKEDKDTFCGAYNEQQKIAEDACEKDLAKLFSKGQTWQGK